MKLLLLFKTKAEAVRVWRCHYSWLEAPSCDKNLLLHCTGFNRNGGTLSSMYQCQKMLICQAACSQSLASENISICRQNQSWFLQSSRQYQRSTASVQYQDEHGHALCICPIQKYYLPTSLLSSQLSCWKR